MARLLSLQKALSRLAPSRYVDTDWCADSKLSILMHAITLGKTLLLDDNSLWIRGEWGATAQGSSFPRRRP